MREQRAMRRRKTLQGDDDNRHVHVATKAVVPSLLKRMVLYIEGGSK